jgi:hypothetical protein
MPESAKIAPTANCHAPNRSKRDTFECTQQAHADAVKAVARCMLPFEPQNSPQHPINSMKGITERIELWWHNKNETPSYQCAVREIKSKPEQYSVTPYSQTDTDYIMQQGMKLSEAWHAQGRTRHRSHGRD